MSILNSVLKVFIGDKSKQDIKSILPIVNKIKEFELSTAKLSNDQLREKTISFKIRIQDACSEDENLISELQSEANDSNNIDRKEEIYQKIDELNDAVYQTTQNTLDELLPEAFAVIKETAKRFVNNSEIKVEASAFDRELAGSREYIKLD